MSDGDLRETLEFVLEYLEFHSAEPGKLELPELPIVLQRIRKALGCAEGAPMQTEPFTLKNDPAPPQPARFEDDPCRQRSLFAGLDCLPGQGDLFAIDGEPDEFPPASA